LLYASAFVFSRGAHDRRCRRVRALGTSVYRPLDVRIIAATNRDLRARDK
jgi:hypothetical protein